MNRECCNHRAGSVLNGNMGAEGLQANIHASSSLAYAGQAADHMCVSFEKTPPPPKNSELCEH